MARQREEKLNIEDGSRISDDPSRSCVLIILIDDFSPEALCVCVLSPVCVYFPVTIGRAHSQARPQAPPPDLRLTPPGPPSFIPHTKSEQKNADIFPPLSGRSGRFYY